MLYTYSIKSLSQSTSRLLLFHRCTLTRISSSYASEILYESIQLHSKAFFLYCYYKAPEAKEENFIVTPIALGDEH